MGKPDPEGGLFTGGFRKEQQDKAIIITQLCLVFIQSVTRSLFVWLFCFENFDISKDLVAVICLNVDI